MLGNATPVRVKILFLTLFPYLTMLLFRLLQAGIASGRPNRVMATSEQERKTLERKLNEELQEFIASRTPTPYTEGWNEDNWENEMQQHPMFLTQDAVHSGELPPLVEALQQLKYDPAENTVDELADNYKQDGNENFRLKKYRWAIDSYSTGLKQNSTNSLLNATLYTNRAAAHYRLQNYRSALRDATSALKLEQTHIKALVRGALCCQQLKKYAECLEWCRMALKVDPVNKQLIEVQESAEKLVKAEERDLRKRKAQEAALIRTKEALQQVLNERGVKFGLLKSDLKLEDGDSRSTISHPALGEVHLNDQGCLVWPVIFVYPEYSQTDFVQEFHEDSLFQDHLQEMFGKDQQPNWDEERKYHVDTIQIYFEVHDENLLIPVENTQTLRKVMSHKQFVVYEGWPTFHILVRGSPFEEKWKKKYN